MKDINSRAWAYTPAKRFVRTDHLLNAWGDVFCRLKIHDRLGVRFDQFVQMPHYHLHRLWSLLLNFIDDWRLDLWGDIFCKHGLGKRLEIRFEQFLATPNYYLTRAEEA